MTWPRSQDSNRLGTSPFPFCHAHSLDLSCCDMSLSRSAVRLLSGRSATYLVAMGRRHYSNSNEPVGFIGLGNMGSPMAQNLVKKGHKLIVYDTVPSAVDAVVSAGATKAASPAEVAKQAKTVVTMLPAGAHVRECYTGSDGIFSTVQKGTLLIDSSTIDMGTVKDMADLATDLGSSYIDAPVSGGTGAAAKGILTFMVGGEAPSFERAKPLLEGMGKNVFHCGRSGTGQATKICNNMLLAIEMIGTSESLQLGISLGLDPKNLTEIINKATGRCWSSDTYNPCPGVFENVPSSNNYEGGFGTALMAKDLSLALDAASQAKTITLLGSLARQIYQLMCYQGYGGKDFSSVFKFIEKNN